MDHINWKNFFTQDAEIYIGGGRRSVSLKLDFLEFVPELQWRSEDEVWAIPGVVAEEEDGDDDDGPVGGGSPASSASPGAAASRLALPVGRGRFAGSSAPLPPP